MKIKQVLVSLAALCAITTVVGCASTDPQASESSFDVMSLNRESSAEFSEQVNLNQLAFQKPDLDTNGAVTLDGWQRFDRNAGPKENLSALDVNGDAQINATEFLMLTPKYSKRYHFFADPDKTNKAYSSRDQEEFQPAGWQLFSIRF